LPANDVSGVLITTKSHVLPIRTNIEWVRAGRLAGEKISRGTFADSRDTDAWVDFVDFAH